MKRNVLAQLDNVHSLVVSTLHVCQNSKKSKEISQALANAKAEVNKALSSISESDKRRRLTQTKKSLVVIDNTFSGLIEGLQAKELSVSEFRAVCQNLEQKFIPRLQESLSNESERINARTQAAADAAAAKESTELTDKQSAVHAALTANGDADKHVAAATKALDESAIVTSSEVEDEDDLVETEDEREDRLARERAQRSDDELGDVARIMSRLNKMRDTLPTKLKTPYTMVRMPIAPIFENQNNATHPNLLTKLSIPHTEIPLQLSASQGRYVIFEQQVLLLISRDSINEMIEQQQVNRAAGVKSLVKNKKGALKALEERIQTTQTALEKARTKYKAKPSLEPSIKEMENRISSIQRELDNRLREGRTKEELKLSNEIRYATRSHPNTKEVGFLLAARNAAHQAETKYKEMPEHVKGRDKAFDAWKKAEEVLIDAEAKFEEMNDTLNKLRMSRATKADKAQMREVKELEKELRITRKKHEARQRPVMELESEYARLNAQYEEEEQKIAETRKAAKKASNMTAEDYARSVLAIINERSGTNYSLVTNIAVPNPRNTDILCFWLMPSGKLSALIKATGNKAKVKEWSFAWADTAKAKQEHQAAQRRAESWKHPSQRTLEDMQVPAPKGRLVQIDGKVGRYDMEQIDDWLEYKQNEKFREVFYPNGWKSKRKANPKPIQ